MKYADGIETGDRVPINKNILRCFYFPIRNTSKKRISLMNQTGNDLVMRMHSTTTLPYGDDDKVFLNLLALYFKNRKYYQQEGCFTFSSINALTKAINLENHNKARFVQSINRLASLNLMFSKWYMKGKSKITKMHICSFSLKATEKRKMSVSIYFDESLISLLDVGAGFWSYADLLIFNNLKPLQRRVFLFMLSNKNGSVSIPIKHLATLIGITNADKRKDCQLEEKIKNAIKEIVGLTLVLPKKERLVVNYYYSPSHHIILTTYKEDINENFHMWELGF